MKPELPQFIRRSGVFRNRVCRQWELSAAEALSPDASATLRQVQYYWRTVAQAPWRNHCGTPSRRVRNYDSERRDFVPGVLGNRAWRPRQVKKSRAKFALELRDQ
jgi:hypothetical protein